MAVDRTDPVSSGKINFVRDFTVPAAATEADLVVGAGQATTVMIDDTVVGRQERVEYYDSDARTAPEFFHYDVGPLLTAGDHRLTITLESSDPADTVFADLVARTPAGPVIIVSDSDWQVDTDDREHASLVSDQHWRPLDSAYATLRPHPLPATSWLRGEPPVGEPSIDIQVGDTLTPAAGGVRTWLPAGTRTVRVPATGPVRATIAGRPVPVVDQQLTPTTPLAEPAMLEVRTEPTTFTGGASFLTGPITVACEPAPIQLGEWSAIGLGDWSGAVRYRTEIDAVGNRPWTLDLGDLRGSVQVSINDEPVAEAFCAPFRFTMPAFSGRAQLEITVHNTLGPYLHASTPTTWVFGSQLSSGLFGPVTMS